MEPVLPVPVFESAGVAFPIHSMTLSAEGGERLLIRVLDRRARLRGRVAKFARGEEIRGVLQFWIMPCARTNTC